ncbi:MAG: hypothetical protein ABMB14_24030 [Myxococcota bacterium]
MISHPDDRDGTAAAYLNAAIVQAGGWALMPRVQRQTIGLREMLIRVDTSTTGDLLIRPVSPSMIEGEGSADRPDRPGRLHETRRRVIDGVSQWTRDYFDPSARLYRVETLDGEDVSAVLGAPASGDAYQYRLSDGTPLMPYATYHAAATGRLFDAFDGIEVVEGTYEISVLWSFWLHCVRDASWPQRWAMGVTVAGASQSGSAGVASSEVEVDPSVVVMLVPTGEPGSSTPSQVGQWAAGCDPDKLATSIMSYESRLPIAAGLNPADFARTSGDPRSAYALSLSLNGQREAARRYEPMMADGDRQLLTLCAAGLNRWNEAQGEALDLPETGWQIRYPGIPESADERKAKREHVIALLDRGLMTKAEAYAELRGVSLDEATRATTQATGTPDRMSMVMQVVSAVSAQTIPRDAGVAMVAAVLGDEVLAEKLLGSAGEGFAPAQIQGG